MIKFFRKIRKNLLYEDNLGKYLKYAIGEIVLVVIGILIALQINNGNIKKTERFKIKDYSESLIKDLEKDIIMANVIYDETTRISNRIDSLAKYVKNKKLKEISNIDFLCLTWNISYRPYMWNRSTLEQLKSSGSLQFIEDVNLLNKIGEYDSFTYHLDEDYANDKVRAEDATKLVNKVININYINFEELQSSVLFQINKSNYKEFNFFSEPEYFKSKSYNLRLNTNDINDINLAINTLMRIKYHNYVRYEHELPSLIRDAEELIALLKETYYD